MSNTQFVSSTNAVVAPNKRQAVVSFLAHQNVACNEAWVLARAAPDAVLEVRLVSQLGVPLSDTAQLYGSGDVSRSKLQNVRVPSDSFPPVVRLEARNASGTSDALVEGVLLVC